ncbi:MAG: cadherin repeat domain-containing protein [Saprospiraceae bacterium]|nr:cadherin repeat domain-containing protein [Saprospiraceae bacterium]
MKTILKAAILLMVTGIITSCSNDDPEPEATLSAEDFILTIDENQSNGTVLGTITANSSQGTLSFTFSSQSPAGSMSIDAASGELTVADETLFDFETNPEIIGTVAITDGVLSTGASIRITLNDVEEFENATFWRGERITFTKDDGANPNNEANQDQITNNVWITRGNDGGQIFNIASEGQASQNTSPVGTEWAIGTFDDIAELTFEPFRSAVGKPSDVVGKDLVMHLITDDIYIEINFLSWSSGKQGGFSYQRTTE